MPILCGYELQRRQRLTWLIVVCFAIVVGIASVVGMSFTIHAIDALRFVLSLIAAAGMIWTGFKRFL